MPVTSPHAVSAPLSPAPLAAISLAEARHRHADLVASVLDRLTLAAPGVNPADVSWHLVECHDDMDQPLDEGAAADVMLTGRLPCRFGVCGFYLGRFGCACHNGSLPARN
jgi:hypothetical protein